MLLLARRAILEPLSETRIAKCSSPPCFSLLVPPVGAENKARCVMEFSRRRFMGPAAWRHWPFLEELGLASTQTLSLTLGLD